MKLRALVVDDESVMRRLLIQLLPHTGLAQFEFVEAVDGVDALTKFRPGKFDILFVDMVMPHLNGIGLVRKVRSTGTEEQVPIVMVTGDGSMGTIEDALDDAGADVYITKPYTVDTLRRQLAKLVEEIAKERGGEGGQESTGTQKPAGILQRLIGGRG